MKTILYHPLRFTGEMIAGEESETVVRLESCDSEIVR